MDSPSISNRLKTGYSDLDYLLNGGLPEKYTVVLNCPSCDERNVFISNFLETGLKNNQVTFYISSNIEPPTKYAEKSQTLFYLFVCNPRADVIKPNLPNVYRLKGVENLTEIDISLTRAYRTLDSAQINPRRVCMEIISDVLLQHHSVVTRKWLSGILADLKSNGFTTLAVIDPNMHPAEEVQAIIGLFEGEIHVSENETAKGIRKTMRIRKMYNQKYHENEIVLTKANLPLDLEDSTVNSSKQNQEILLQDETLFETNHSICAMCSKQIKDQPLLVIIGNKEYSFDSPECINTFKKFKRIYGDAFS